MSTLRVPALSPTRNALSAVSFQVKDVRCPRAGSADASTGRPVLHDPLNSQPWTIEAKVAFRVQHWQNPLVDDVRETRETDDLNQEG